MSSWIYTRSSSDRNTVMQMLLFYKEISSLIYSTESQTVLVSSPLYTFGLTEVSEELLFMWVITSMFTMLRMWSLKVIKYIFSIHLKIAMMNIVHFNKNKVLVYCENSFDFINPLRENCWRKVLVFLRTWNNNG